MVAYFLYRDLGKDLYRVLVCVVIKLSDRSVGDESHWYYIRPSMIYHRIMYILWKNERHKLMQVLVNPATKQNDEISGVFTYM